jgi:malate dehydrogenase (oxaloacetate-decarboxylating)
VGLGVLAVHSRRVTDGMFLAAARALAGMSPAISNPAGHLLPTLDRMREVSRVIAIAVAKQARSEGLTANYSDSQIEELIQAKIWEPQYRPYQARA